MEYICHYHSPLGGITLAGGENALTGLWFDGQKNFAETLREAYTEASLPVFAETCRWLDIYFSGRDPGFTPALNPGGTEFRRAVWEILLTIPYGGTITYGEIASRLADRTGNSHVSSSAVGGAVGHNPVALIVPCHRVIGANGKLTGYAGGLDKKIKLLELERI